MRTLLRALPGIAIAFFLTGLAMAQTASTGTILGVVSDPTGAVVPGAKVELEDAATQVVRTVTTNDAGRYLFVGVSPGTYAVRATATGFKVAQMPSVVVEVSKSYSIQLQLEVGETREAVEVTATPAVELQTMDSTVGSAVGGDMLLWLPSQQRNVTNLLTLQATAMPQTGGTQLGGQVSGARADQNFFMLDGGDISNGTSGNTDYLAVGGLQEGSMPTPVESIQEFRTATTNPTASFTGSAGGQILLVTKRGSNTFHGSLYEFLQNSALNANSWGLNRIGSPKPVGRDNRFGASLGGYLPKLPEKFRTYFYLNYEGRRQAAAGSAGATVPTDTLRQGILRFRDAAGNIVSYNLATAAVCGTAGNAACDPRGIGINPLINSLWSKYLPVGNNPLGGDQLNTTGFTAGIVVPTRSDFGVIRLDHSFGPKWQLMSSYRYFSELPTNTAQVDVGGLVEGNKLGQPAPAARRPREPRYLVLGLTGTLSPNLTNEFNYSYMRDWWQWVTAGALPQVSGTSGALGGNLMVPVGLNTYSARQRAWNDHRHGFRENLSWLKGTHMLRFGGTLERSGVLFWRNDGNVTLTQPIYNIAQLTGVSISSNYQPRICSASLTTNCLPSNMVGSWNSLYAQALGLVDSGTQFMTRGPDLTPYAPGTVLSNNVTYTTYSLYATDSWHVRPTLTFTYGVNWTLDMPPHEAQGKQIIAVSESGQILDPVAYMQTRQQMALKGQVYNPVIGFEPIQYSGRTYPYDPVWDNFAPRLSAAWSPKFTGGWLHRVFGDGKTVFRGGYARLYDRLNGVQKAIDPLQGLGYGQSQVCMGPSRSGACLGPSSTDPSTAFRIGVDGSAVPIPALSGISVPFIPGTSNIASANQPYANSVYNIDPTYKPSPNHSWNFTVQRAMPGNSLLEIGYVGRHASGLYSPIDLNQAPFFMVYGGQSFAQAFDNVAAQLRAGNAPTPQPFFESALAGSSLCTTNCTAGVAAQYSGSFLTRSVYNLWNGIQPSFVFGAATPAAYQTGTFFFYTNQGYSNYNAGFLSYRVRDWKGLSLDANFTFGHSLDTAGQVQSNDTNVSNAYNLDYDYGPSPFDRKFVFNLLGYYQIPLGRHGGNRVVNYMLQDWAIAPIFSAYSGLPLEVTDGSCQEFGQGSGGSCTDAILITKNTFGHSAHFGVTGSRTTGVGISGDPATGGSGINLFADPNAVYNAFRPVEISRDTTSRGGVLRGQNRWNLDLNVTRRFRFGERISTTFSASFFNVFNHVEYSDPSLNLQSPNSFGVISGQFNSPRVVEFGLHLDF